MTRSPPKDAFDGRSEPRHAVSGDENPPPLTAGVDLSSQRDQFTVVGKPLLHQGTSDFVLALRLCRLLVYAVPRTTTDVTELDQFRRRQLTIAREDVVNDALSLLG
jgi:hypothetical protein